MKHAILTIAHRGFSSRYPENTLVAFKNSFGISDMIELDVTLTSDRIPVVIHDATLERTTDGSGNIRKTAFVRIRTLDAGKWFGSEFSEKIPSLEDVLELIRDEKILLNIEIKPEAFDPVPAPDNIENQVMDLVVKHGLADRVVVSSFSRQILERVRSLSETIKVAVLITENETGFMAAAEKLQAYSINPPLDIVTEDLVRRIHDAGRKIFVWTVNSEEDMDRMIGMGVDGMFTNYPDVLYRKFR